MKHPLLSFSLQLGTTLIVFFLVHVMVLSSLDLPKFQNQIVMSYVVNGLMAFGIFFGLYKLRHKHSNHIGFLFLAGSFLKFGVFFLLFYNNYKADETITTLEFLAFFLPYSLCLILETYHLSKWLNRM